MGLWVLYAGTTLPASVAGGRERAKAAPAGAAFRSTEFLVLAFESADLVGIRWWGGNWYRLVGALKARQLGVEEHRRELVLLDTHCLDMTEVALARK